MEAKAVNREAILKAIRLISPNQREEFVEWNSAEAEISFKAGYNQCLKDHNLDITTSDVV